ncbi:ArnT family glycosyltransferase [Salegentibacter sediminis]|uniref:ArnT family glycosyltransferase n=1 Tax=Salegentibacter sediminis TaxID=1930251 RepID=UPI001E3A7C88|nr:glycosyltransferase family 39 protein [Salegentibacter sediminis]
MPKLQKFPDKYLLILFLVGAVIFLTQLDVLYVNIMEARNFIAAREMLEKNNWLLTTLNDLPRYQKPPLPTWLTALSAGIFRNYDLYSMRLPAALMAMMLLFIFYAFQALIKIQKKQAFLSALILATSFYIVFSGRDGQWDIFTHAFMMGSIFFLVKIFQETKKLYRNAIFAAVFFAASLLSKGPVSLYALFLPFLIAYGLTYNYRGFRGKRLAVLLFIILGILLGTWWFIYVRLLDPESFLKIATQETSNWANYNIRPFYYYWSFVVQSGIWTIPSFVALLYPYLKNKVSNPRAYKFSFLWTIAAVVLLSVIPEKKSRYLLPVLIPMAINTGFYIEYLFRNFRSLSKSESWIVYFNHGLIALIGLIFPLAAFFYLDLTGFWFWYIAVSVTLFGIGLMILYFLWKKKYPPVFYLTVSFIAGIILFGFPLMYSFLKNPHFNNISNLKLLAQEKNFEVYEYKSFTPELIWEYGSSIPITEDLQSLENKDSFGILFMEEDSLQVKSHFKNFEIKQRERYDLNYVNPEAGGYKDRLIRAFYFLERRD